MPVRRILVTEVTIVCDRWNGKRIWLDTLVFYAIDEVLTLDGERRTSSILFVDDEPSIRLTLPPILEEQGFQVHVADSIPSALQQVSSQKFDVLLSDLNIDEPRDGFALVKAARAANPSCVIIILTGYPDFESAVEGINCNIDGYLVKPADIETLLTTIQERLAAKNFRQS
jgi:DNA-binding NtrC family response regulator